ncbi:MAG: hypothetical protein HYT21_01165 [Candidatus Nealsonbacteria bacterium]|nr:hypothetical protein [Candidatus Nealsonbacteria bacterium]
MIIASPRALIALSFFPLVVLFAGGFFVATNWKTALYYPDDFEGEAQQESSKTTAIIKESPRERSKHVKGIYMNEHAANSKSANGAAIREEIAALLSQTELNAVVIDIKEADGAYLPSSLKNYINELHEKDVWVIARISAFRDSSLREQYPEWYLWSKRADNSLEIWQDAAGGHWLDPKGPGAQNYIIDFSKKAVDFGFDELQFDYIRFPSDGSVGDAIYPFYNAQEEEKYDVIGEFFNKISQDLREYDPDIILSVDLFGYVAAHQSAAEIGQRTYDAAQAFDYISYMLYPSHFYSGLQVGPDERRDLPAINLSGETISNSPYSVIARSIFIASDYLASIGSAAKIRPWLQDFNINKDTERGIYYDAKKVREQILAAEESGASGWLLWNPSAAYTKSALSP